MNIFRVVMVPVFDMIGILLQVLIGEILNLSSVLEPLQSGDIPGLLNESIVLHCLRGDLFLLETSLLEKLHLSRDWVWWIDWGGLLDLCFEF